MPETLTVTPIGLLRKEGGAVPAPVPLLGVTVAAQVRDYASRVVVCQRYRNQESKPLEAVYVFPLDEGAAVCGFEALIDGVHVVGRVKERDRAFEEYDDALGAGQGAYLLDQERPDVFTASIGNLPPGSEVIVRITYVAELAREGDDLLFALPTTVSPRYAPPEDRVAVGRSAEAALNPPKAWSVPYGLELRVDIALSSPLKGIESPTHPLSVEMDGCEARVTLGERQTALDRDFVLRIRPAEPAPARALVEEDEAGRTIALLSFEPRFETADAPGEYVFLLDRSGSMQGTSILEAKNALQLCLRGLRTGDRFNVLGFGSRHESLFPHSRPYDQASLDEAAKAVDRMEADLGGTEILSPLERIFTDPPTPGLARQLFVLTDGQVTNTEAVLALVRKHSVEARVFAFGIGAGASAELVRGLARAGEGEAEFIAPGERIEEKVLRQLRRAHAPALTEVALDWGGLRVTQAPHQLPPVFAGSRLLVYGSLEAPGEARVVLRARGPAGPVALALDLRVGTAVSGSMLSTLFARTAIRDLEEGRSALHDRRGSLQGRGANRVKAEIVRLGVSHGLCSRHTSFVAVEQREVPVTDEAVLRRVPVALTRGWGGGADIRLGDLVLGAPSSLGSLVLGAPSSFYGLREGFAFEEGAIRGASHPAPAAAEVAPRSAASSLLDRLRGRARRQAALKPSARPGANGLLLLQRADGSWELSTELCALLGRSLAEVEAALPAASGDPAELRRAWATALALAWLLQQELERTLLEMAADKARDWLARTRVTPAGSLAWLEAARSFL